MGGYGRGGAAAAAAAAEAANGRTAAEGVGSGSGGPDIGAESQAGGATEDGADAGERGSGETTKTGG